MKASVSYQQDLLEFLKNPRAAVAYLNAALEDGDEKAFLLALRNVMEARGGLSKFSRLSKINRVSLYRMLSKEGNPEWGSIMALLQALGVQFHLVGKPSLKSQKKAA